jgi:hypothetical protein
MGLDLVFYAAPLIFVDEATEDGSALDPPVEESGIRVVRPGRVQLPTAMGPSSVVMAGVLGEDRPEVSFTEDQHSVGNHGPGDGQDRVEGSGELPGAVEERLASVSANFVYVFDPDEREGRTWDNADAVEDVATGSAAGPAAAFLAAHGLAAEDEAIVVNQGRFLGRPSVIAVTPDGRGDLGVGGPVAPVARGVVDLPSD